MGLTELPADAEPEIVWDILEYFLRNPDAADSVEGIVRWRLLDQLIRREVERATEAVGWLLQEGYLLEAGSPAAGALLRLNKARLDDARTLLERHNLGRKR